MNHYERTALALIVVAITVMAAIVWLTGACMTPKGPDEPAPSCATTIAECCAAACRNLERLHCPGWQGSPGPDDVADTDDDVPCDRACEYAAGQQDIGVDLKLDCVAAAQSCVEVEACPEG